MLLEKPIYSFFSSPLHTPIIWILESVYIYFCPAGEKKMAGLKSSLEFTVRHTLRWKYVGLNKVTSLLIKQQCLRLQLRLESLSLSYTNTHTHTGGKIRKRDLSWRPHFLSYEVRKVRNILPFPLSVPLPFVPNTTHRWKQIQIHTHSTVSFQGKDVSVVFKLFSLRSRIHFQWFISYNSYRQNGFSIAGTSPATKG